MVSLTVYDGAASIGGNKIYLEDKGAGVFLDFGKMEVDFHRLWQWLMRVNISPYGISQEKRDGGEHKLGFEKRYQAPGHASGEDITWAIDQIDPDYRVPVQTEARDWFSMKFET